MEEKKTAVEDKHDFEGRDKSKVIAHFGIFGLAISDARKKESFELFTDLHKSQTFGGY